MQLFFWVAKRLLRCRQQPVERFSALLTATASLDTQSACYQFDRVACTPYRAFVLCALRTFSACGPAAKAHAVCVCALSKFDVSTNAHVSEIVTSTLQRYE